MRRRPALPVSVPVVRRQFHQGPVRVADVHRRHRTAGVGLRNRPLDDLDPPFVEVGAGRVEVVDEQAEVGGARRRVGRVWVALVAGRVEVDFASPKPSATRPPSNSWRSIPSRS